MNHRERPPPREEGSEHDFAFLVRKLRDGVPYDNAIKLVWPPVSAEWCIKNEEKAKWAAKKGMYPRRK